MADTEVRPRVAGVPSHRRERRSWAAIGVLAFGAAAAAVLHRLAGMHYPTPWPDESHFLAPALALLDRGSLAVPALNAPEGMFWMPDGYTAFLAAVLALPVGILPGDILPGDILPGDILPGDILPGDILGSARAASLVAAIVFALCAYVVGVRLGGQRLLLAAAAAAWLVAPRVVLMSDIARMDSLVLAIAGGALVAAAHRRWPLALALAATAPLVHPAGLLVLAAIALPVIVWPVRLRPQLVEAVALVAVATATVAEGVRFATHLDLARVHLSYQVARKADRAFAQVDPPALAVGALAAAGGLWSLLRRRVDDPDAALRTAVFGVAAALVAVHLVGQEMWYEVLGVETAALLTGIGLWCGRAPLRDQLLPTTAAVAAVIATFGLFVPLGYEHWGLRLDAAPPGEWAAFWDEATDELHALDASLDEPATVVVDYLSGFGALLAAEDFTNLRVVQPTQVTGALAVPGEYALYTPTAPEVYRWGVTQRLPAAPPVVSVVSASETFALQVYAGTVQR